MLGGWHFQMLIKISCWLLQWIGNNAKFIHIWAYLLLGSCHKWKTGLKQTHGFVKITTQVSEWVGASTLIDKRLLVISIRDNPPTSLLVNNQWWIGDFFTVPCYSPGKILIIVCGVFFHISPCLDEWIKRLWKWMVQWRRFSKVSNLTEWFFNLFTLPVPCFFTPTPPDPNTCRSHFGQPPHSTIWLPWSEANGLNGTTGLVLL